MDSSIDTAGVAPHAVWTAMLDVPPFGVLAVELRIEAGYVLATESVTHSYGEGRSPSEAVASLNAAVRRHYAWLQEEGMDRLSGRFQAQLVRLQFREAGNRVPTSATSGGDWSPPVVPPSSRGPELSAAA